MRTLTTCNILEGRKLLSHTFRFEALFNLRLSYSNKSSFPEIYLNYTSQVDYH